MKHPFKFLLVLFGLALTPIAGVLLFRWLAPHNVAEHIAVWFFVIIFGLGMFHMSEQLGE